jgi:PH/SEC7 domain-containing protein
LKSRILELAYGINFFPRRQNNAQLVGELVLTHSLCSAMPPPGYSRDRPHIFVLTLASGSSYFFQAGTEDLVNEWVQTCNYWAGRLSKEPLMGGVSNMEYGWNRVLEESTESRESTTSTNDEESNRSSRSRVSISGSSYHHPFSGNPNDKTHIVDWMPPAPPSQRGTLSEESQLESLRRYVGVLQGDLKRHNELRQPMMRLVCPVLPLFHFIHKADDTPVFF